jgi:YafQ family addiction module toxin component
MMEYRIHYADVFEKQLKKIKGKDPVLFERLSKKMLEVALQPEHYKPLRGDLAGARRVHIDPFVLVYEIDADTVIFHYVKHHDKAY